MSICNSIHIVLSFVHSTIQYRANGICVKEMDD